MNSARVRKGLLQHQEMHALAGLLTRDTHAVAGVRDGESGAVPGWAQWPFQGGRRPGPRIKRNKPAARHVAEPGGGGNRKSETARSRIDMHMLQRTLIGIQMQRVVRMMVVAGLFGMGYPMQPVGGELIASKSSATGDGLNHQRGQQKEGAHYLQHVAIVDSGGAGPACCGVFSSAPC